MVDYDEDIDFTKSHLSEWDFVVIVVYFACVLTVGIWVSFNINPFLFLFCSSQHYVEKSSRRARKTSEENKDEIGGYFLASRDMHFYLASFSIESVDEYANAS